jgi:hypothetical protein
VRFGFSGKGLWERLDRLRNSPAQGGVMPMRSELVAEVKYFGRIERGFLRDSVLLSIGSSWQAIATPGGVSWSSMSDLALSFVLGIALAAATGFRVFLPMLFVSGAAYAGHVHLDSSFA